MGINTPIDVAKKIRKERSLGIHRPKSDDHRSTGPFTGIFIGLLVYPVEGVLKYSMSD